MQEKKHKIAKGLNLSLVLFLLIYHVTIFMLAPWYTQSTLFWMTLFIFDLIMLRMSNVTWHLAHEATHNQLVPQKELNTFLGKLLGYTLFSSFTALQLGHLTHHKANRISDISDLYFEEDKPTYLTYYFEILGGHYLVNAFLMCYLSFMPSFLMKPLINWLIEQNKETRKGQLIQQVSQFMINPKIIRKVRQETIVMSIFFAITLYSFISNGLWQFFALNFAVRAFFFSFLNNMPHYGNQLDDVKASHSAWLPKPLALLYLNFNFHKTHHDFPNVPWHELPKVFKENNGKFDRNYIKDYLKQLKGPIYYKDL